MNRQDVSDRYGEDLLFCDGFDDCILGVAERYGMGVVVAYDCDKIIAKLEQDMPLEEAEDYFSYNIIGAWVGDKTPVFVSGARMGGE